MWTVRKKSGEESGSLLFSGASEWIGGPFFIAYKGMIYGCECMVCMCVALHYPFIHTFINTRLSNNDNTVNANGHTKVETVKATL